MFDEDIKNLIFPKVKCLYFKTHFSTPLEIAAKMLAVKNEHISKWKDY
jgi:hypothetical protein